MTFTPHARATLEAACRAVREAGGNVSVAARALGLPTSTLTNRVVAAVRAGLADPRAPELKPARATAAAAALPPPNSAERREVARLRAELDRLRRQLEEGDGQRELADAIRAARGALARDPLPPPAWSLRPPPQPHGDAPGVPVLLWTDWHIGETVRAAETHGRNRFDAATADERVRRLVERSALLAADAAPAGGHRGVVLFLGGDFVSGWLHDELFATDYCSPLEAARWCVSRLAWAVRELQRALGCEVLLVGVPGNHGRLFHRPPGKRHAAQSFDFLIYGLLADLFAGEPGVTVVVPEDGEATVQVAGTKYLLMHGHQLGVKGGDGIIGAIGPIMRGASKVGTAQRSLGRDFDVLVLGHYHQCLWLPSVIVGPTLKGWDEYARVSRFPYAPAAQLLWFSHPKWGPNSPVQVYLQDPPAREPVRFAALEVAAP